MKIEEENKLDQFLRDSLGTYGEEPPRRLWKGILQRLPYHPFGNFLPDSLSGIIIGLSGGIIILATLAYFLSGKRESIASADKNQTALSSPEPQSPAMLFAEQQTAGEGVNPGRLGTAPGKESEFATSQVSPPSGAPALPASDNKPLTASLKTASPLLSEPEPLRAPAEPTQNPATDPATENIPESQPLPSIVNTEEINPGTEIPSPTSQLPFTISVLRSSGITGIALPSDLTTLPATRDPKAFTTPGRNPSDYFAPHGNIALKLYFRPEWLEKGDDGINAPTRKAMGTSVTWQKAWYSIEGGLEIGWEKRPQPHLISYNQFLGTYDNLDSISFELINGVPTPTYYYSTDSVYDPKMQSLSMESAVYNTYIRLPLLIGFEWQNSKIKYSISGGPVFNLLIYKRQNALAWGAWDKKVSSIINQSTPYQNISLQWTAKAGIHYYVTDRFGLSLEPSIHGFVSNPYDRRSGKIEKPLYWGIQSGLFFTW